MASRSTFAATTAGKSFCPHPQEQSPGKSLAAVADSIRAQIPARPGYSLFHVAGWAQHNQRVFMMNQSDGWMNGWSGGGMWLWTVIGVLVVVLLVVVIRKLSKK